MMRSNQLYAKLSKCKFWLEKVTFLGHVITKEGVLVDLEKIVRLPSSQDLQMSLRYEVSWIWQGTIDGLSKISRGLHDQ